MSFRASFLTTVLICGCSVSPLAGGQDPGAAPPTGCILDADCAGGRICVDGLCAPVDWPLDLSVAPADLASLVATWFVQFGSVSRDAYGYEDGQGDAANDVATDPAGNAYVTGFAGGALEGSQSVGRSDAFLVKFDPAGKKLWLRQFGTADPDGGSGVATDGAGDVYVTGTTWGALGGGGNAGNSDFFLVKFDPAGNRLWARQFGTPDEDGASGAVVLDGAGNIYAAGHTYGQLEGNQGAGGADIFLVKIDGAGNRLWTRQFGTAADDEALAVSLEGGESVFVTGYTLGGFDGNANAGDKDAFLAKLDVNGNRLWTRQFGSAKEDVAQSVAADGAGNIFVGGKTLGAPPPVPEPGMFDAFVMKFDAMGNRLWTRHLMTRGDDYAHDIVTDRAGHAFVMGGTEFLNGIENKGLGMFFLVEYDENGNQLRALPFYYDRSMTFCNAVANSAGGIYVAGTHVGIHDDDAYVARFPAAP